MKKLWAILLSLLLLCMSIVPALAADSDNKDNKTKPAAQELKLDEAIALALQNSKSLRLADLDVDKSQKQLNQSQDSMGGFIPDAGVGNGVSLDKMYYNLLSNNISWELSKKTLALTEDQIVLAICNKYWAIQKNQEDVKGKELTLNKAKLALQRVRVMVNLGMTPSELAGSSPAAALTSAEKDVATAQSDLENAQNTLNTAYESMNKLIGLSADARPALIDAINYEPIKDSTPDVAVQRAIENSPSVWSAEEQAQLAKITDQSLADTGQYSAYGVTGINQRQADIRASSAKDSVELSTRNIFYSLKNIEVGIDAAEKAVKQAEEAVRVAKISLELGMITKEDLAKSEIALETANYSLLGLKINHAYWVMALQKPWAVSGS